MSNIPVQTFIDAYTISHGAEEASKMVRETTHRLGLEGRNVLTKDEAISVCQDLQNKAGFVGIVAGILLARFTKEA